jgi:heat-inducible transcriptional repressor
VELTARQQAILRYVIEEYIRTGRAIGSKALLERVPLGVSSATIRNEMMVLEEAGLLQQPHTSAGRVPTEAGFRYYVEHLLDVPDLPPAVQIMVSHQFRQVEREIASWLKLAAAVLANTSQNLGLATPPHSRVERVRHFELLSLRRQLALLVLVTQTSAIHQSLLELAEPIDQAALSALSERLNPEIQFLDRAAVERKMVGATPLAAQVLRRIVEALQAIEQEHAHELYAEGLEYVVRQPEVSQSEVASALLELLRSGVLAASLLERLELNRAVQVLIGSDLPLDELRPFSIVLSPYWVGGDVRGVIGVLGPQRMPYDRSIAAVRYLADVLSRLMQMVYAEEGE